MILNGRVAIVTGAASGIGRAAAAIMAREGAHVAIFDRDDAGARRACDAIVAAGGKASCLSFDVADESRLAEAIDSVAAAHGSIDILHNHAGVQIAGTAETVAVAGFDLSWGVNVRAHFLAARRVLPIMRKAGRGVILNTSSSSGVLTDREMIAYTTTKHAVVAMTRQLAADYAQFGIRVNALCPGWVDTAFNDPFTGQMGGRQQLEDYIGQRVPMGRFGTVDEMAEAALFLVSDRSSYITGQALVVDGGETI